jgi:hypothetical protein
MPVQYIGANGPDGMCFGLSAAEKVGFFGATPVVQVAMTAVATATATTTLNELKINRVIAALASLGLTTTGG